MIKNLPLNKTRNVVSLTLLASTTPKVSFRLSILVLNYFFTQTDAILVYFKHI
jgi:hypothetical protein